ncbi:LANO_0G10550g1_1 [Lachancea nothofagi CBS 11611]|uniref:LANO_0G10550g1_1 n=1 Tax=Lachancea nothofagi CBS 11611 TaxID=1266666 RepID=A0A1G4KJ31_9SACH|nr:LANO_0G10550g1_1 [Lachancea nothofagi CBS 11611]
MEFLSDPWGLTEQSGGEEHSNIDLKSLRVRDTLKNLNIADQPWEKLALLIGDDEQDDSDFLPLLEKIDDINNREVTGVTLLIYCIVFDRPSYIELLHGSGKLDPNLPDNLYLNSPLTWCFNLNRQQCALELLNFAEELDIGYKNPGGSTALELLVPGTAMYEFSKDHGLFQLGKISDGSTNDLYKASKSAFGTTDVDQTIDQIDLQTAGLSLNGDPLSTNYDIDENSGALYTTSHPDSQDELQNFDFDHILPGQFIEFSDYDIPRLLELVISMPFKKPHKTCIPAAIIFQCIRYADYNKESVSLVESIAHLSLVKILASITTTSGGVVSNQTGDIVLQSYWLSSLNFLYYYLYRQEGFYKRYPSILQELIDGMRSLIIELNASIHSRIEPLLDSTILEHTTIAQVRETLYKKDWNLLKKRKQRQRKNDGRDSYDQILLMLYPPSLDEQMKPSPLKTVQIFGALTYVLDLHQVHPLLAQQCLSLAVQWFSVKLFNKIMDNKKKSLSRAHAIQIRLNLSVIQDWIKNHNFKAPLPEMIDEFMWQRFPHTLILSLSDIDRTQKPFELRNVTFYKPIKGDHTEDMNNSLFFYQSFYQISKIHMEPCMQLLQWLQVATSLEDEDSLESTMTILNLLTPLQLYKSIGKYRYEIDEEKFASKLRKKLSLMCHEREETDTNLPEKPICSLTLPTITELIDMYTQHEDSNELLPIVPLDIQDDVDEIHEQNIRVRKSEKEQFRPATEGGNADDEEREKATFEGGNGDELFRKLNAPSSAAQRPLWAITNDMEENPW